MFDDLNNNQSTGGEVEDILSGTEPVDKSESVQSPGVNQDENLEKINQEMIKQGLMPSEDKKSFSVEESLAKNRTLFIVGMVGVVVVVLAIVGWLLYRKYNKSNTEQNQVKINQEEPVNNQNTTTQSEEEVPIDPELNEVGSNNEETIEEPVVTKPEPADSDMDGLTDDDEIILGTNIHRVDTDSDGLSDYDEVNVFGTDPTSADTDRDGYLDGEEVANGYNPNGAGKLQTLE